MVPVVFHPDYLAYNLGDDHPFSPLRLAMVRELLAAYGERPAYVEAPLASREDVLKVHAERYVKRVEAASRGEPVADLEHYGLGTGDTPVFPEMDRITRRLVGGTVEAALWVAEGRARRALQLGGGLHHAQHDRASGFCVYNDLAVAIRTLLDRGLRVAYVDVDVHHGDGVQWIFYDEPRVLTVSFHESGRYLFPGTGHVHELGRGEALGTKLNVPFEPFTEDESWIWAFEAVLPEALAWFEPDLILVQAGADAHYQDPLADLLLTTRSYLHAFPRLIELAERYAGGRIVFTLGGGYSFDATPRVWTLLYYLIQEKAPPEAIPEDFRRRWQARLGVEIAATLADEDPGFEIPRKPEIERRNRHTVERLLESARIYWERARG